ncbi:MAG TPA: TCP-1/cpn60 chaperonin family protein, partial [Chlamydiales bacterium]|nr:TCP-1/cpn60 chaperonin family protein [Chlamydiales bacterium]
PRQISDNAGIDATDVLNKLRMRHAAGERWVGIDVDGADTVRDNLAAFVWEPSLIKTNAISSAVEAACLILSVDETVKNPQSEQVHIEYSFNIEFPNTTPSAQSRTSSTTRRCFEGSTWPWTSHPPAIEKVLVPDCACMG